MSLSRRVPRHSRISSVLTLGLAAALAACSGGSSQKIASSYPTQAPGAYEPSPASQGHASIEPREMTPDRPGLGTSWGEAVAAPISFAPFVRAAPSPWAEVLLHYNDVAGVRAHADYLGMQPEPLEISTGDGALTVALVDDAGRTLPGYTAGGRTLVLGEDGQRYRIVVRNQTSARFEIVTSVDGLDVIDGNPADPNRRGYLVDPHGTLAIDGFRTSDDAVAAFRFGRVADSYAAQTTGDRNVGVVGMAIFAERGAVWNTRELQRRDTADPFPQRGYAAPPR
ncbi:MAG: hypothetical protein ABIY55_21360 [Kofleriaceae bacterium]